METIHFNPRSIGNLDSDLIQYLKSEVNEDPFWGKYLADISAREVRNTAKIHLAIFVEPFLQYLLDGKKTIESRFSINRCPPFNSVSKGDILMIKKSGGPVLAICTIKERWYYRLNAESWDEIKQYQDALCAHDPEFWADRADAGFATLILVDRIKQINPVEFNKKDRRGWVVLSTNTEQYTLL